jgi:hypothetical protein
MDPDPKLDLNLTGTGIEYRTGTRIDSALKYHENTFKTAGIVVLNKFVLQKIALTLISNF